MLTELPILRNLNERKWREIKRYDVKSRKFVLNDLISDSSFIRWAIGEAAPAEIKRWNGWVEYSEENRMLAIQAQKLIAGFTFDVPEATHRGEDWEEIKTEILQNQKSGEIRRIRRGEEHVQKSGRAQGLHPDSSHMQKAGKAHSMRPAIGKEYTGEAIRGRQPGNFPHHQAEKIHHRKNGEAKSLPLFLKAAAVFLILAVAGLLTVTLQNDTPSGHTEQISDVIERVQTNFSEKKIISISDGSEIILAAGSSLSYKEDWLQQSPLRVVLEKGEAYFSIQPDGRDDRTAPRFEVETEDGVTAVMGTKFTVTTYGEGTRVVLEQGEVQVTPLQISEGRDQSAVTLVPGEMAEWSRIDPSVTRTRVNARVYTSWISDYLYFDDTPLSLLIDRIERTYGVDVVVEDPELRDLKLSGALDFYGLDELAGAVSEVLGFRLVHNENNMVFLSK